MEQALTGRGFRRHCYSFIGISIMKGVTGNESTLHSWMTCRSSRSAGLEGKEWPPGEARGQPCQLEKQLGFS